MKAVKLRPWLTSDGVEIPTVQLKEIAKGWVATTWEEYLDWYEGANREKLIVPEIYNKICDEQSESIFQNFNQNVSAEKKALCDFLLSQLPPIERRILRSTFFDGRTVREIAAHEKKSKSGIHDIKNRALTRLRRGLQGEVSDTRQYIGRDDYQVSDSIWDKPLRGSIREAKVYDPKKYKSELAAIKNKHLRIAIGELPEFEQRLLYLRFWCDFSFAKIARELAVGVNTVDMVCDTAISKLKTKMIAMEGSAQ